MPPDSQAPGLDQLLSRLRGLPIDKALLNGITSIRKRNENHRLTFLAYEGEEPRIYLYCGPHLEGLYKKIRKLAKNCPAITSQIIAWDPSPEADLLALNYITGDMLENLVEQGKLTLPEALQNIQELLTQLKASGRPSTAKAFLAEIHAILDTAANLPFFQRAERDFILGTLRLWFEEESRAISPVLYVTNGDFIARNVVITAAGTPCLIDYEFAGSTHFFEENFWRWNRFSNLPPHCRNLSGPLPAWMRALFLLKQLTMDALVSGTNPGIPTPPPGSAEILRDLAKIVPEAKALQPGPLFSSLYALPESEQEGCMAHLFWNTDGTFSEACSIRTVMPAAQSKRLSWTIPAAAITNRLLLRLDPLVGTGFIEVDHFSLSAVRADSTKALASSGLIARRELLNLGSERFWLSTGQDPQWHITGFTVPENCDLLIEIGVACYPCKPWPKSFIDAFGELQKGVSASVAHAEARTKKTGSQLEEERAQTKRLREQLDTDITELRKIGEEQQSVMAKLNDELDQLRAKELAMGHSIDEQNKRCADLQNEAHAHLRTISELKSKAGELQAQIALTTTDSELKVKTLSDRLEHNLGLQQTAETQLKEVRALLADEQAGSSRLREHLDRVQNKAHAQLSTISELKLQAGELRAQIARITSDSELQVKTLSERLEYNLTLQQNTQKELQNLRTQLADEQAGSFRLREHLDRVQNEAHSHFNTISELKLEAGELQAEIARITSDFELQAATLSGRVEHHLALQNQAEALAEKLGAELDQEKAETKHLRDQLDQDIRDLRQASDHQMRFADKMRDEMSALSAKEQAMGQAIERQNLFCAHLQIQARNHLRIIRELEMQSGFVENRIKEVTAEAKLKANALEAKIASNTADADHKVKALEAQIAAITADAELRASTIIELRSSTSWRLTTPLRLFQSHILWPLRAFLPFPTDLTSSIRRIPAGFEVKLTYPKTGPRISRTWVQIGKRRILLSRDKEGFFAYFKTRPGLKLLSLVVQTAAGDTKILANRLFRVSATPLSTTLPTHTSSASFTGPLVSIIVPNYNHSAYLPRRLDSIYGQTYRNFEVILLDDASTDESHKVLKAYQRHYSECTRFVPNQVNTKSPFSQWAKGIGLARGEIIWIAESDDYCDPDFLEKLIPAFCDPAVMISYCITKFVNRDETPQDFTYDHYVKGLSATKWSTDYVAAAHEEVRTALAIQNTIPNASSALIRKPTGNPLLRNEEWLRMRVCGDWIFYLSVIRGGKIAFTRSTNNYYRQHPENTSTGARMRPVYYKEHEIFARYLASLYQVAPEVLNAHQRRLEEQWVVTFRDKPMPTDWSWRDHYDMALIQKAAANRKPNVMIVCHDFMTGGGEMFAIRLALALHQAGIAVTFYDFNGGAGKAVMRSRLPASIPIITRDVQAPIPLDYFVNALGIEIISTHHSSCEWMFAQAMQQMAERGATHMPRLVATLHGMHNLEEETLHKNRANLIKHVAHWIYVADKNVEPLINQGMHIPEIFTKIPTGVFPVDPAAAGAVSRKSLGVPSTAFIVCVASRAIPEKGWLETIAAVERVRKAGKNIHLLLVGEGPVYQDLKKQTQPPHIHLAGFQENVTDYYSISNVGVLSSSYRGESAPLCIIDCLSTGTPIVATDCGEIRNMITAAPGHVAGVLFPVKTESERIEALTTTFLRMIEEPAFYQELASQALRASERFLMPNIGKAYTEVFDCVSHVR